MATLRDEFLVRLSADGQTSGMRVLRDVLMVFLGAFIGLFIGSSFTTTQIQSIAKLGMLVTGLGIVVVVTVEIVRSRRRGMSASAHPGDTVYNYFAPVTQNYGIPGPFPTATPIPGGLTTAASPPPEQEQETDERIEEQPDEESAQ